MQSLCLPLNTFSQKAKNRAIAKNIGPFAIKALKHIRGLRFSGHVMTVFFGKNK
jgi:hypothetical protein